MFDVTDQPRPDDDLRLMPQYGADEQGNVRGLILVVGVGIDDDVAPSERLVVSPVMNAAASPLFRTCEMTW